MIKDAFKALAAWLWGVVLAALLWLYGWLPSRDTLAREAAETGSEIAAAARDDVAAVRGWPVLRQLVLGAVIVTVALGGWTWGHVRAARGVSGLKSEIAALTHGRDADRAAAATARQQAALAAGAAERSAAEARRLAERVAALEAEKAAQGWKAATVKPPAKPRARGGQ